MRERERIRRIGEKNISFFLFFLVVLARVKMENDG